MVVRLTISSFYYYSLVEKCVLVFFYGGGARLPESFTHAVSEGKMEK